jgi:hypothetical protein
MTEDIIAGDFVVMNRPRAKTVGLVYRVESGFALTWWRVQDKPDGRPQTTQDRLPVSELKIVPDSLTIPASMILLREDNFPKTSFRTRRE